MYKNTFGRALVIALGLSCLTSTTGAETLKQVYQQALQNDHQFKAARAAFDAGQEEKNLGRSGLLPQVTGDASLTDSSRDSTDTIFAGEPPSPQQITIETDTESTTYNVSLTQPLFNMAAWHRFKRGQLDSKVAQAQWEAAKQDLIIRTAEAYFNALQAVDNYETAKSEEEANELQLEQTRKRFEVGLTAITEVHEAQAAYDSAVARRLLEEGNIGIRFEALEVITGVAYEKLRPLQEEFPIVPPTPADRQEWVDFSLNNNFNLAAASLNAESARQFAREQRAGHIPRLSFGADYRDTTDESEIDGVSIPDAEAETTTFSLNLTVPIFSGGGVSAGRRQAAARFIESRETYLQTQRDTIQSARSLHLSVLTDVATVKARAQAIVSNRSALEATRAGYDVGTRDLVDVLNAQRSLFVAQQNYSDALYTYVLNTLRLKQVAGILSQKDIDELDQWLDRQRQVSRIPEENA